MKTGLFIAMLLLFSLFGFAQATPVSTIPFMLENNTIYVFCKINSTDSLKFLFDTGADGSVINKDSKRTFNLKIDGKSLNRGSNGTNDVEVAIDNTIRFGDIERTKISFTLISFGTDSFDGIIGTDLMKGYIVELDYNTNELKFYKENDPEMTYSGYEKTKLHLIDNYPAVENKMIVDGVEYKGLFGIDTGADDILTIAAPFAKRHKLNEKMKNIGLATAQGSDGSVYEMPVVLCSIMNFSNKFLYNLPVLLSSSTEGIDASDKMAGFLGNKFLKRFNTILDFKNRCVYFKLNKNLYSEVYQ